MKIIPVVFGLLALISTSTMGFGFSDSVTVGPFSASFNMSNKENLTTNISKPLVNDGFIEYGFKIMAAFSKRELIDVAIDYYNNSTDVSESHIMNLITNKIGSQSYKATWDRVNISSNQGIAAKIRSPGKSSYVAAYSLDGLNDTGRTVVFIRSFAAQDMTDSFLRDFQVIRSS